ncbi:MAG TPA: SpoIIE family protein phosphatase [Geobacteraceae bacterium]
MIKGSLPISGEILDSVNDGLYVTDTDRRILYWNKSAERITGWTAADVVGHRCMDNILIHEDKDGRRLCTTDFCPLFRCMVTDRMSTSPVIIFAQTKAGGRVPVAVSVAPLHDADGKVIGAVETFQDYSETYANLERAKQIQTLSLEHDLPQDSRVGFTSFYLPHDMIGGDYFAIRQLDADHYGFFLADVMGHGVAAALHTMHLSSLWSRYCNTLMHPKKFAQILNRNLCRIVKGESFATAICGILDASGKRVRIASAGGPPLVLVHPDGRSDQVSAPGLPFGMIADADYDEREFPCASGDSLLMFTDGAIEINDAAGRMLGTEGLIGILGSLGYPESRLGIEPLEEALLNFSNGIRLEDDLTLLEVRFS